MVLLDEYDRKARLIPGLMAVVPVAVAVTALGLRQDAVIALAAGLLSTIGGPFVLANYVRSRGLAQQDSLWNKWGGAPTTVMQRHRGTEAEKAERHRLRGQLRLVLGLPLPLSEKAEAADPVAADAVYKGATRQLISRTGDRKKFRMVFVELRNYGYERNLLGMRPVGLLISGLAAAALVVAAMLGATHAVSLHLGDQVIGSVVEAGLFAFWLLVPSETQTKRVAEAYATRLMEAAWTLKP